MQMKLLEFPHSHYCEKARWALDYKQLQFQAVAILPGLHMLTVRKYAPQTLVPVLIDDEKIVQGAGEIIDYLEEISPANALIPAAAELDLGKYYEQDLAERLGLSIRQILYQRLLAYPDFVRYCFTQNMPAYKGRVFCLLYPILRKKMYQRYVLSDESCLQARRSFDAAMDELAKRLEGMQYLVADKFSRADLSVAAMLSLLAMPPEHPFPWKDVPDQTLKVFYEEYANHPATHWVRKMYAKHRKPKPSQIA